MTQIKRTASILAGALLLAVPLVTTGQPRTATFKSGMFEPARVAPDFELSGSNGSQFILRQHRGKVVALAFGFTHCVRVCPTTLATLAQVSAKLGADAGKLQVVFVTVDPERDSVDRLREYLAQFDPSFVGVTGPSPKLQELRRSYGITIAKEPAKNDTAGYQVHHSSSILLIDREGKLRLFVPFGKSADQIVHDIELLLG